MNITLMGTNPRYRGMGYGSRLIEYLFDHARQLRFCTVEVFTVPPGKKPAYHSTVAFYQKHGFVIEKEYQELWECGAVRLIKKL
jgi:GNAT superfamily N-acetyltransferase